MKAVGEFEVGLDFPSQNSLITGGFLRQNSTFLQAEHNKAELFVNFITVQHREHLNTISVQEIF